MRKIGLILLTLLALHPRAQAETGHEGAIRQEAGRFGATAVVTGSSVTGTAFVDARVTRPGGVYFNNTASTVWIGTTSATVNGAIHTNINIGFPLLSSSTISMASFTGTWYFTCNGGTSTCEMRELEGRIKGD